MTIEIGRTIANQIGGEAFRMIGTKDILAYDDGIQFDVMRNDLGVTHIQIKLTPQDDYEFTAMRLDPGTGDTSIVSDHASVYCDQLCDMIELATGLVTTMPVVVFKADERGH